MIDRGKPPRAYAAAIIAGNAIDHVPEHLRGTVACHVETAIFVYTSAVMRCRSRWERNHKLALVPEGVREQVQARVVELFKKRQQLHGV